MNCKKQAGRRRVISTALSWEIPYWQSLTLAGKSQLSCSGFSLASPSYTGLSMALPYLGAILGDMGLNQKSQFQRFVDILMVYDHPRYLPILSGDEKVNTIIFHYLWTLDRWTNTQTNTRSQRLYKGSPSRAKWWWINRIIVPIKICKLGPVETSLLFIGAQQISNNSPASPARVNLSRDHRPNQSLKSKRYRACCTV